MVMESVPFSYQLDDINTSIASNTRYHAEQTRLTYQKPKLQRIKPPQTLNYGSSQPMNRSRTSQQIYTQPFDQVASMMRTSSTPSPVARSNSDLSFVSTLSDQQLSQLGNLAASSTRSSTASTSSFARDQASAPLSSGSSGSAGSPWNTSLLDMNTKNSIPFNSTWSQVW
ncbi:hypothetical protein OGAPHI_003864 [Ogataea philodendri]|uniref:Uncharacterized protein n=1 Tax=Ogataea philodendri TaxID=1378263 RepID=A0A9P8T598_9ASCO|nr:uncharacterized protein OGAPHI_003864 [Ogataea philodendri]KAH3665676.1 hypothetical protein OGAPHI_003864 [Ogataea philodendri]